MPVQIQPASILGSPQPVDKMVKHVASYIGGDDDPEARDKALDYLDRAADRLNSFGIYLFARRVKEYTVSGGDIADGDTTVDFPADFGWPTDPVFVDNSSGDRVNVCEWRAWEDFKIHLDFNNPANNTGPPRFLSYPNELTSTGDSSSIDGKIHVWPSISSTDMDKLTVTYIARVPRPSEVADPDNVRILPECREAMLSMAVAMMQQNRRANQPNIWRPFMEDAWRQVQLARRAAFRQQRIFHSWVTPDERGNLTVIPFTTTRRTTAFIRI